MDFGKMKTSSKKMCDQAANGNDIFDDMKPIKIKKEMQSSWENPLSSGEIINACSVADENINYDMLAQGMKIECDEYQYPDDDTAVDQMNSDNKEPSHRPLETNSNVPRKKRKSTKRIATKRRYACDECDKSFKYSDYLVAHKECVHLGIRSHVCEHCDKNFISAGSLKQHAVVHSKEQPFTCDQCDKSFTQLGSLTYHKRSVHERIRTHACSQCTKRFFLAKDLAAHVLSHTGEKPFACDKCSQSFTKSNNLLRHKKTVHLGIRSHECKKCNKHFTSSSGLKKHLNRAH